MTELELAKILRERYDSAKRNEATKQVHLFGIEYGQMIKENGYKVLDIVSLAGMDKGYATELSKGGYTACLGIPLAFQLGARLGELVTLKWSDIDEEKLNHIHIQRMERKIHEEDSDGKWKTTGYEVVEHTKSEAGDRNTYLTKRAREILELIRQWNIDHGFGDNEFIFLNPNGERIHNRALDTRIRKYCSYADIDIKSMHKIRKTYISTLVDSHLVNINTIREMVGHEDERTTLRNYTFNRKSDAQTQANLEKALSG